MVKLIVLFILLLFFSPLIAQKRLNNIAIQDSVLEKNVMFFEAAGNGILISINYERLIFNKIGLRIGVGSLLLYGLTVPAIINYYIGNNRQLELGIGTVYTDYFPKEGGFIYNGGFLISTTIGYKFQKEGSNIILRFSFTPLYSTIEEKVQLFGGISLGCAF